MDVCWGSLPISWGEWICVHWREIYELMAHGPVSLCNATDTSLRQGEDNYLGLSPASKFNLCTVIVHTELRVIVFLPNLKKWILSTKVLRLFYPLSLSLSFCFPVASAVPPPPYFIFDVSLTPPLFIFLSVGYIFFLKTPFCLFFPVIYIFLFIIEGYFIMWTKQWSHCLSS